MTDSTGNGASASSKINNTFDLTQLNDALSQLITDKQGNIFDRVQNNSDADQKIDNRYLDNLDDMDRIPDVVKSLREFYGQPGEFSSWRKSVDRILRLYENLKGTPKYFGILSVIRNKITGQADTALESYNTPLNWERISKCLTLHYADKRDLGTLEYQMTTLVQRQNSIPEFYQQVYQHLSLILNKLSSMEMSQEAMDVMTNSYRDKALDTFVRGLKGDLPRLLSIRGPVDLPEALHLCLKLENVQYRIQHSHAGHNIRVPQVTPPPPLAPRRISNVHQPNPQMRNFYPELLHKPQIPQPFSKPIAGNQYYANQHQFPQQFKSFQPPPRIFNKTFPQPMSVDHSIHSGIVNYQNRPRMKPFVNKRPHSNQMHQPVKHQRIYQCEPYYDGTDIGDYQQQMSEYDAGYDQTLVEYTDSIDNPTLPDDTDKGDDNEEIQIEQLDDVHFLD